MLRLSTISACIVALCGMTVTAKAETPPPEPGYKVVAYYIAWGSERKYTPLDIDGRLVTHINYAFADIRDGKIAVADPEREVQVWNNFAKLKQLKRQHPHLKTLISVGGWTRSKEFSNVALTPASRDRFAQSAVAFVRRYGFDGVDIDWEFPVSGGDEGNARRPEDKQNYTLLMKALRDRLDAAGARDGKHYLVTTAMGTNDAFLGNTEMDKVAAVTDFINIMTYDFSGHWNRYAGHLAPLHADPALRRADAPAQSSVSSAVDQALAAGIPANKLVMGMPFYGYSWRGCGSEHNGQNQDCGGRSIGTWEEGALDYADIVSRLADKGGYVRYWNDTTRTPYLFNAATKEFISYDDEKSIGEKAKFIRDRKLAGAMFWEITGDRKFVLQRAIDAELRGSSGR